MVNCSYRTIEDLWIVINKQAIDNLFDCLNYQLSS